MVPADYQRRPIEFIAAVEAVSVEIDTRARVVVNERTGTVVIGSKVRIAPVSIAHGNLSIQIETQFEVSQPQGFSQGQTAVVPQQQVTAVEEESGFVTIGNGATVDDLISALNSMGVTPRDTIAILEALKAAGALQADLARISHQWSAAAPDTSAITALRLVGRLNVLSSTPPSPSRRAPCPGGVYDASRRQLVRKAG